MAWLKIIFNPFYSKIDAFDYDHEAGAISNRRTAVQIDPALGVSLQIMCHALCEKCLKIWDRKMFLCLVVTFLQRKKAKFPHSPIHHYASIYGALLFSVSPVRCTCIIKYGAVRKFFQKKLLVPLKNQPSEFYQRARKTFQRTQGVKLRLIQAPVRLNFSLWRPNPGQIGD